MPNLALPNLALPNLPDLPADCLEIIVQRFDLKERVRFFCVSSTLYQLSKHPDAEFFRSGSLQLTSTAQEERIARWLAARRDQILDISLCEMTPSGSRGSTLQHLGGGPLTELDWAVFRPGQMAVGDLRLRRLRRLHLTITEGTGADSLTLGRDFSRLTALEELWVEEVWPRASLLPGCLPSSLTSLHLGPSLGTGYLPEVIAAATQLRQLRVIVPQPAGRGVERFGLGQLARLTGLELWQGRLYSDFSCLTSLELLTLWNISDSLGGLQLSVLQSLARLTSLSIWRPAINASEVNFALPLGLSMLTSLRELVVVSSWFLLGPDSVEPLASLSRLTRLVLRGTSAQELPAQLTGSLTSLVEVDLGR